MMLAQLTMEMVVGMPAVVVTLSALLWMANEGFKLAKNVKGKTPEPANETLATDHNHLVARVASVETDVKAIKSGMVGKEWFNATDKSLGEIKNALEAERTKNEQHISLRSSSIYKKLDESTASLRTEMQTQSDRRDTQMTTLQTRVDNQVGSLQDKIEQLPDRLLLMLKNIQALGKGSHES